MKHYLINDRDYIPSSKHMVINVMGNGVLDNPAFNHMLNEVEADNNCKKIIDCVIRGLTKAQVSKVAMDHPAREYTYSSKWVYYYYSSPQGKREDYGEHSLGSLGTRPYLPTCKEQIYVGWVEGICPELCSICQACFESSPSLGEKNQSWSRISLGAYREIGVCLV